MKTKKVLNILQVTRQTLTRYVKEGKIRVKVMPNGFYDYNDEDVYRLTGLDKPRISVIYSRVSTQKQKNDLDNQEKILVEYCNSKGIEVSKSYKDIASGLNFDRKGFKEMFESVLRNEINTIYVTYKDRFSRVSFDLFERLFKEHGCEIIVLNDIENVKSNEEEIFEDIISMLHCFSMRMYSRRRKRKLEIISEDLENEIGS